MNVTREICKRTLDLFMQVKVDPLNVTTDEVRMDVSAGASAEFIYSAQ